MTPFPSTQSYILRSARRGGAVAWAIAAGALAVAVVLRMALDPYLGDSVAFVTLFAAVAIAVWVVGSRVAIGFALVGYLICHYLFVEPRYELSFDDLRVAVGIAAYAVTCWLIIAIGEATRSAEERAQAHGELLRVTLAHIDDAVIATDGESRITYLNESAELLTGWSCVEAIGHPLNTVFRLVHGNFDSGPITRTTQRRPAEGAQRALLLGRDAAVRPIEHGAAPIKGSDGLIAGCVVTFRDISEKQQFERQETERVRTERLLEAIVASSDDAIISESPDGIVETWNAGAERTFGYLAEEMIGRPISRIVPADRAEHEEQRISAALQHDQRIEHFEAERAHRSGRRVCVSLTISRLSDEAGTVVGAATIARDTTRQRAIAQRERLLLRETAAANERFRAFLDQSAVFAAVMQPNGAVLEASRISWESCGYRSEQIIGRPFWEGPWWARAPILVERIKQACEHAARGDAFRAEIPYFLHDGTERLADLSMVGVRNADGQMLFLAATAIDVTERKRAEDDRQKLAMLVENSTDIIATCGIDFVPAHINPTGLVLLGLESIEDARCRHVRDFFPPEDRQRMMEEFFPDVMREGHGVTAVRLCNFRTGGVHWIDCKVLTLRDTLDRRIGYAILGQAASERRALDERVCTLAANQSEADRRENALLATLAHELRNPLAPLCNALELVRREGSDPQMPPTAIDTIGQQTARIVRVVDDLLDLSRIARDKLELRKDAADLGAVLRQAVASHRTIGEAADQEVRVDLPPEPVGLHADSARLVQVFSNLIGDSCKHTHARGTIVVAAQRAGDWAIVTVEGDGNAMPRDTLESSAPREHADTSLEHARGGSSIGLTLAAKLVEMHGGSVKAESAEGKRSSFVVRLPAERSAPQDTAPATTSAPARKRSRRVLVVDDNHACVASLARLLTVDGHRTFLAHDGAEALEAAEEHRPEVAILDIGMPEMSGYELCRRLRERYGKDMLILALTGWGEDSDRRRADEAGFDGYFVKPANYSALAAELEAGPARKPEGGSPD